MSERRGKRPPSYIPAAYRALVLDQFTKADLAEIAWDLAEQETTSAGDRYGAEATLTELRRRRDVVALARAQGPR